MGGSASCPSTGNISNWYSADDIESFLQVVERGDAIEINRGSFSHWGIYVGDVNTHNTLSRCIVHASSPEDAVSVNIIFTSASIAKRDNNLGIVQLQSIENVAGGCYIRINNLMDKTYPPLDKQTIVERAFDAIQEYPEYDLLNNNCEHFVHWCRNDVKKSSQVDTFLYGVAGVVGGILLSSVALNRNHAA